jgi:hypothetical protein
MSRTGEFAFDEAGSVLDEESEETLETIDERISKAEAGSAIPIKEVRKLMPQWITASSSQ